MHIHAANGAGNTQVTSPPPRQKAKKRTHLKIYRIKYTVRMKLLGSNLNSHPGGPQSTAPSTRRAIAQLPARVVGNQETGFFTMRGREAAPIQRAAASDLAEGSAEADPEPARLFALSSPRSSRFPCPQTTDYGRTKRSKLTALPASLPALRTEADLLGSATLGLFVRPGRCSTAGLGVIRGPSGKRRFTQAVCLQPRARRGLRSFSASWWLPHLVL